MSASKLFSPQQLGPHRLSNRLVMAPLTRCRAGAGNVPSLFAATYYAQRATAGLIITEATQVMPEGQGYVNTPGIYSPEQTQAWKKITDAVHEAGGKIFLQLWHVGRISHSFFQPNRALPVAPSAIPAKGDVYTMDGMKPYETPHALKVHEIKNIVAQYKRGAQNAKDAGFDGVEVHAANGYLIDQFLQSETNIRVDEYGGSVENRARFMTEAVKEVIDVWGADRVGVRLSPNGAFNDMHDANPEETFRHAVSVLNDLGVIYLHLREGTKDDERHGRKPVPISIFRSLFKRTLMLNDKFTRDRAEVALNEGRAELIAFGTLFLANPDLPQRFKLDAPLNTPDASTFYGGGEKGYTDYPTLQETAAASY